MNAIAALARRDFLVARSYRIAFAFDLAWGVIDLLLYFFLSHIIGDEGSTDLHGAPSYFAFAVAGVLASLVVGSATSAISASIRTEQVTGTLEMLVAQPIRTFELAFGTAAYPFAYALARVGLYLLIAIAALHLPTGKIDWLGLLVMLPAAGVAFVPLGILAAAVTVVFKRGQSIVDALIFGMTFISGAVIPISVLPGWLQPIGNVMPTKPAFDGLRDALFRDGGWGIDALKLLAFGAVGVPIAVYALERAFRRAKRTGSLAQY